MFALSALRKTKSVCTVLKFAKSSGTKIGQFEVVTGGFQQPDLGKEIFIPFS